LAAGLRYLALTGGERYNFGIWIFGGVNSVIAEYACYSGGLIAVPLDDTLSPHECASIVNERKIEFFLAQRKTIDFDIFQ